MEQAEQGVLIFGRTGSIELVNKVAADFLENREWKVADGRVSLVNKPARESQLDTLRFHFLTTVSHEFRTPLSTVLSSVALAESHLSMGNTARAEVHLTKIKHAALQINTLLSDFLSLSNLEEGKISWQPMPFDAHDLCAELVQHMQELAKPGQQIFFQSSQAPCPVFLDQKLFREVLFNLLLNAIRYSDKAVHLSVCVSEGMLEMQIKDEGIGIPDAEQKFIFEQFFRANNAMHIPGTGLGLCVVKKYLEMMSGAIDLKSTQGKGSVFFVKLPTSRP